MLVLHVCVDTSGSMSEIGKIYLQRNLCRYIDQLRIIEQKKYNGLDIRFYKWAQEILEIAIQNDGDIPALSAEGSSRLDALSSFLSQHLNNTESLKVLVLSDGTFSNSDIESFKKQLSSFKSLLVRTVAIGVDADFRTLEKISTNNTVYLPENIASALDSTIFGSDDLLTAPTSLPQTLQSVAKANDEEEDWDA